MINVFEDSNVIEEMGLKDTPVIIFYIKGNTRRIYPIKHHYSTYFEELNKA